MKNLTELITFKLEEPLIKKVLEVAKKRKPHKKYKTYAKALREAIDFFIEANEKTPFQIEEKSNNDHDQPKAQVEE